MASISNDPGGRRRLQFFNPDGKRCAILLGKIDKKTADRIRDYVEKIITAKICRTSIDDDTARWIAAVPDKMHTKLSNAGLLAERGSAQLGTWLDGFIAERTDLKPRTIALYKYTAASLIGFFGRDRIMRDITRDDASRWHAALIGGKLAIATVRLHVMTTRTLIGAAVKRELIARNVFDHLEGGTTAAKNDRYVTVEEAEKIIDQLTMPSARMVFVLARFAGLRVPSETHQLTWKDVDWDRSRLTVRSPKTERHAGHEQRIVPITPRLMPYLQKAYDEAPEGQTLILPKPNSAPMLWEHLYAAIDRAGVDRWEDAWRLLRANCERQWAMTFPQYAVSKWIGHSIAVSGKHYANHVPDELFTKAAQNPAQHTPVVGGTSEKTSNKRGEDPSEKTPVFSDIPADADLCLTGSKREAIDPSSHHSAGPACD